MNILLIYPRPDVIKNARFGFSYELLLLATILRRYHETELHDYSCEPYCEQVFKRMLSARNYDLILVECDSFALKRSQNTAHARQILSIAKQIHGLVSIAFGYYCCIKGEDFPPADFTVKVNDLNLILDKINQFDANTSIKPVLNYDDLPRVDRSILLSIPYYRAHKTDTLIQTSKGCQNSCIFCQRKGWQSTYVAHSDEYTLKELCCLSDLGFNNVWVIDENFTFKLDRAKRLLTKYIELQLEHVPNLFISSWTNIDKEFIDLAAKSNIRIISFGIESGDADILKYYRKNIVLDEITQIVRYANDRGIFTVGNFILGAPMETQETIEKTFDLIRLCEFDQVNFKILDYMIGAELYDNLPERLKTSDHVFACAENGLCSFPLDVIAQKKNDFVLSYYAEHKNKLTQKIALHGYPYAPTIDDVHS